MRVAAFALVALLAGCVPATTTTYIPPAPVAPAPAAPVGQPAQFPVLEPVVVLPLTDADGTPIETIGMANPASVNCGEQGGRLEFRTDAAGQSGYCHLPDGRVVEEWALYRETHPG